MKQLLMLIPLVFLCCITLGCRQGEETTSGDVETDVQAIKDIIAELNTAMNSGDIEGYMPFYADEMMEIYPNEPAVIGKEAVRRRDQQLFDEVSLQDVYTVKDVKVSGDLAVAHFTWSTIVTFKANGKSDDANGNSIMVFEKQPDDAWKVVYWIYSDENLIRPPQA